MCHQYPVMDHTVPIGSVAVTKEGLYYRIVCRLQHKIEGYLHLMAVSGGQYYDFGICIPYEDGFGIRMMLPAKTIDLDNAVFYLSDQAAFSRRIVVGEPFDLLDRLQTAHLELKDGAYEAVFISCPNWKPNPSE